MWKLRFMHFNTNASGSVAYKFKLPMVITAVGNGENILFWSDRWLHEQFLEEIAPNVHKCVANTRTVANVEGMAQPT